MNPNSGEYPKTDDNKTARTNEYASVRAISIISTIGKE